MEEFKIGKIPKWKAISITVEKNSRKVMGLWNFVWGTDIFINNVPFLKCILLSNIVVWGILWLIS